MRDRLGYCAKCLVSFTDEPRGSRDEDLCSTCDWWDQKELTDVEVWMADQHAEQPTMTRETQWQATG